METREREKRKGKGRSSYVLEGLYWERVLTPPWWPTSSELGTLRKIPVCSGIPLANQRPEVLCTDASSLGEHPEAHELPEQTGRARAGDI